MIQTQAQAARDLIETLVAGGVRSAVISPGSRNTPLVLAAEACARLRCHVAIDERVAGFMALGMSRVSGCPTLLICTSGSALAHYLPAALEASASRIPMIILSAARPLELTDCGAPQALNQAEVLRSALRWWRQLPIADERGAEAWAAAGCEALSASWGAPEGVVHLNCPFREPLWVEGLETSARPAPSLVPSLPMPDLRALDGVAARLEGRRGVVLCGPMHGAAAHDERLVRALTRFTERIGWPVFAEPASRLSGRLGSSEVGYFDRLLRAGFVEAHEPDVVLQLGAGATSKVVRQWLAQRQGDLVVVDRDGLWRDPSWRAALLIAGDEAAALEGLGERLDEAPLPDHLQRWRQGRLAIESSLYTEGWSEAAAMRFAVSRYETAVVASSLPIRHLEGWVPLSDHPRRVVSNRGLNGIDGTIATAIGVAQSVDHAVLAVVGDVACVHDLGALAQVVAEQPRLTVMVIDNGGGGIFRRLPIAQHDTAFERYFQTKPAIDLARTAKGIGLQVTTVTQFDELEEAFSSASSSVAPGLVLVRVDPAQDQAWRNSSDGAARALVAGCL